MKKILLSITSIIFTATLVGGTGAWLTNYNVNTSSGNTIATGIIDLKVDNESYVTDVWGNLVFSSTTSWALSQLEGKYFFKFDDIKPGDIGEDTISLHVKNNNAWACMNIKLTSTKENGQTEPEDLVDPTGANNSGELQETLYFKFWADDGDNVYEVGEKIFKRGWVSNIFTGENWTLADSQKNIWDGSGPLLGNTVKYIGKAWCFGDMHEAPLPQDGLGKTGANGPLIRGTGFGCDGRRIGNIVQSDSITADVNFFVTQSRNDPSFRCEVKKTGKEYCSHGYWKQNNHFYNWTGHSPNQQFSYAFENAFPGKTMLQVLQLGGGGLNRLGRETVTALLNAGQLDFPYSQAEVISMFNNVFPGSNASYENLADKFQLSENCPLN
jgi:hypothetical protein